MTPALTLDAPSLLRLLNVAHQTSLTDPSAARGLLDQALDRLRAVGLRPEPTAGLTRVQAERLSAFIDARLHESLPLERLAREAGLSASYLCRAFRVAFGASPHAWIVGRRLARAQTLMCATPETLAQIALACGFADQAHFTRLFARNIGVSPSRWRRDARERGAASASSFKSAAD